MRHAEYLLFKKRREGHAFQDPHRIVLPDLEHPILLDLASNDLKASQPLLAYCCEDALGRQQQLCISSLSHFRIDDRVFKGASYRK